jgi:hypothetical protein
MTLVATPYSIDELGEDEERHEIVISWIAKALMFADITAKFLSRAPGTRSGSSAALRKPRDLRRDGAEFSLMKQPKPKLPNAARRNKFTNPIKSRPSMAERRCNYSDVLFANASG